MISRKVLVVALASLAAFASNPAQANEPIVRVELSEQRISLGESARMRITVLVPTWQPDPPVYPSFELPNVVTRLPPDSSHPTSERVNGETWSGIVRNYQVTPLIAADFQLGGEAIRITWADPGNANRVADVPVPLAGLSVRVPAGAEGLEPYLAGTRFTLERSIDDYEQPLQVGDALTLRYRASLLGMPALFIPPLAPAIQSKLVTAYPEEPVVSQGQPGERVETITLVLNYGGQLELPGQTLAWWNTETAQIEQVQIEALALEIEGPAPASTADAPTRARSLNPETIIWWLLGAGLLVYLLWRRLPGYLAARQTRRAAYEQSEAYAFALLSQATDASTAYGRAVTWIERLDPHLDLRSFAAEFGSPDLAAAVDGLSRSLFNRPEAGYDHVRFVRELGEARAGYLARVRKHASSDLAPLNPT